jgi:hypothetical protein
LVFNTEERVVMKKVFILSGICLAGMACAQVKQDNIDFNYSIAYKDSMGFAWSSKFQNKQEWDVKNYSGRFFMNLKAGATKINIAYDTYYGQGIAPGVANGTRYGLSFINSGPNTTINFSMFQNDNFGALNGMSGKIDINMKF